MNISEFAKAHDVSTDTVRYYEKQGLLNAPSRQDNGYRFYTDSHGELLRFVRGAQGLGFSLAEIRIILPQLAAGKLARADIEVQLHTKMTQIDAHIKQLQTLKKALNATFASLKCEPNATISAADGTPANTRRDAGMNLFTNKKTRSKARFVSSN
jgi:MerR family transcriptional regulator, copper efflux regulator